MRKVLITAQFSISIFVVVCTLFMRDQIEYVRNKELGFDKENIMLLPVQDTTVEKNLGAIKNEMLLNPKITKATTSYNVMGFAIGGSVMWAESETGMKQQSFSLMFVGEDYLSTMGMTLATGRDFGKGQVVDD